MIKNMIIEEKTLLKEYEMEKVFQSDIVKNANKELKAISDNLTVQNVSSAGGKIQSISISVPIKGNKDIISSLETLGWKKGRREKYRTDVGNDRNQYYGYQMNQGMTKYC